MRLRAFKKVAAATLFFFGVALTPLRLAAQTAVADYSFAQLQQAPTAGNVEAMTYFADVYYDGDLVPQNYALAADWYKMGSRSRLSLWANQPWFYV